MLTREYITKASPPDNLTADALVIDIQVANLLMWHPILKYKILAEYKKLYLTDDVKLKSIGERVERPKIILNYETPDVVYNLFSKPGFTVLDLYDRSDFY